MSAGSTKFTVSRIAALSLVSLWLAGCTNTNNPPAPISSAAWRRLFQHQLRHADYAATLRRQVRSSGAADSADADPDHSAAATHAVAQELQYRR